MIIDVIEDIKYRNLMEKQIFEIINYLLTHNEEFSLTANITGVDFCPMLPKTILDTFSKFTIFALTNYTYTTIQLQNNTISFEAGFGKENFGSIVTIPFYAIFQLIIQESILFVNPTATVEKYFLDTVVDISQEQRSKRAFSMNPKNKKYILDKNK